ncbi:MAG: hypothetical protein K5753_07350 [Clostridia bacterium]|nr:hypothetical protein [Clostridia bacterium]
MKERKGKITFVLLIVIIAVLLVAGTAMGSYAAYIGSRSAQRTVATYDAQGERFSSNTLVRGYSRDNVKTLYVTDSSVVPASVVTICNYERGKQTLPNSEPITYSLLFRFVKHDPLSDAGYVPVDAAYMTANALTAYTATLRLGSTVVTLNSSHLSDNSFSGALNANIADSDSYTLTFGTEFVSGEQAPNLYVEMVATPQNVGLHAIGGIFKTGVRAPGAANSWTGDFSDDKANAPSVYDGYNYLITGVGEGTVTLTWDNTRVELSDYSKQILLSIEGATQTGSSVTFRVDSDVESRYDLQFYKRNVTTETWSDMLATVVTFRFGA